MARRRRRSSKPKQRKPAVSQQSRKRPSSATRKPTQIQRRSRKPSTKGKPVPARVERSNVERLATRIVTPSVVSLGKKLVSKKPKKAVRSISVIDRQKPNQRRDRGKNVPCTERPTGGSQAALTQTRRKGRAKTREQRLQSFTPWC
ncbi:hypothetical protein [Microviridae sp.]|nr:hypothetical protein [Microviridae sp.]